MLQGGRLESCRPCINVGGLVCVCNVCQGCCMRRSPPAMAAVQSCVQQQPCTACSAGPWLEMWWRLWLRQEGSWGYQHASECRGWSDKALPLSTKAREQLESEVGRNMRSASGHGF
jgi:hypothetical protein